jgi:nucleotide-binding universal stress UspA family protein
MASAGDKKVVLVHVRASQSTDAHSEYDPAEDVEKLRRDGLSATSLVYRSSSEDVAEVLSSAIHEAGADLVVMSTHGRGGLGRAVFGSVTDTLMRRAEIPVLLIPPHSEVSWQAQRPAQILVPLDGSRLSEEALAHAANLAGLLDAEILLVRALSPVLHPRLRNESVVLSCADFIEVEDAWRYLAKRADCLRLNGRRVSIRVLVGSPAAAIADAAQAEGIDLIVMTTHGRGGLGRFLLGSVADGVLQRTGVPVVLIRSGLRASPTSA